MWLWSVQRPDSTEVPFWYCSSMMNSSMRWQAQRWPRSPASLNSAWRPPPHLLFSCQSRSRLDPAGDDWRIWIYDVRVCVCVCVCVSVSVCVCIWRIYLWWSLCTLYLQAWLGSYHRQLKSSLLCLRDVFQVLINSHGCWFVYVCFKNWMCTIY